MLIYKQYLYMYVGLFHFFLLSEDHLCNENQKLETTKVCRKDFLILWMKNLRP